MKNVGTLKTACFGQPAHYRPEEKVEKLTSNHLEDRQLCWNESEAVINRDTVWGFKHGNVRAKIVLRVLTPE